MMENEMKQEKESIKQELLQAQAESLQAQADSLQAQIELLQAQARALQAQAESLQAQAEMKQPEQAMKQPKQETMQLRQKTIQHEQKTVQGNTTEAAQNTNQTNQREKKSEPSSFEFVQKEAPTYINECVWGDEYLFFEGDDGHPKYENINEIWESFVQWIKSVRERNKSIKGFDDSQPDRVGQEVTRWAMERDSYAVSYLIKEYWNVFRETYLSVEDCPEMIKEFIGGILSKQMTEDELWGKSPIKPKGKLIVFDKKYLPKEGEDTGGLEVEYCPIKYTGEMGAEDEEECPIKYYPIEKGLFPEGPLFWET